MDKTKHLRKHLEKDDQKKCRSLICDENGIIIGEMVYRCLICYYISDSVATARDHYRDKHVDIDDTIVNGEQDSSEFSSITMNESRSGSPLLIDESNDLEKILSLTDKPYDSESGTSVTITPTTRDKSGYMNCTICGMTRFYSSVQKRYGQNACAACYRYFREFLLKPKVYSCKTLSQCPLNIRNRCKACWLKACIDTYDGKFEDSERQRVMTDYRPVKTGCEDEEMESVDDVDENDVKVKREKMDNGKFTAVKSIIYKNGTKRSLSCMKCENCLADDCGQCVYCLDKLEGKHKLRAMCVKKRCVSRYVNSNE
ncbi:nuclear receptor-like protein [Leptotrombidium deliense]|uniref:Nuclear receptor-like protein n=1 Tax=Leptotrombidium deliense TaxID=299467 RepID=A0A443SCJ0_9ACAR|nr:nuclear receptor-like protein [Leptotrombidium deliense]